MADGEGFEPSVPCGTHAFQACPIDRSGTHPKRAYEFGVDWQRLQPLCNAETAGNAGNQKLYLPAGLATKLIADHPSHRPEVSRIGVPLLQMR
jgi:hypothetical protein